MVSKKVLGIVFQKRHTAKGNCILFPILAQGSKVVLGPRVKQPDCKHPLTSWISDNWVQDVSELMGTDRGRRQTRHLSPSAIYREKKIKT
jgi:hypothetical protein